MDGALLQPDIARRALSWQAGKRLPVAALRAGDLPRPGVYGTPDAHVRDTRDELAIRVDVPSGARDLRVLFEPEGVLHVLYRADRRSWYRRFDFGGAFDATTARAWLGYGALTLRVPRRRNQVSAPPAMRSCPAARAPLRKCS